MKHQHILWIQLQGLGLWCYFVAVSFIDGGNWSTQRKPSTFNKLFTVFIT